MDADALERFYTNLASVINGTVSDAKLLVRRLNTGTLKTFTPIFNHLPTASVTLGHAMDPSASETLFTDNIGKKGHYGIVHVNRTQPLAYKIFLTGDRIITPEYRLAYLKDFFKEAIIQVLLQSDSLYGHHICHLHKLYKTPDNLGLFKMDKVELPFKYILEEEAETPDRTIQILAILAKLFEILIYFYNKYNFQHNDVHAGNIMTIRAGDRVANLKLIDFGMSCAKIGDIEIEDQSEFDDLNQLFAYPPVHVPDSILQLFRELEALGPETDYDVFLKRITEEIPFENAWMTAFDALGPDVVDSVEQFKADFTAALQREREEGLTAESLPAFIDEYVFNYRRVLQMRIVGGRRSTSTRKTSSRRSSGSRKTSSSRKTSKRPASD
jgi:hypothetical protein